MESENEENDTKQHEGKNPKPIMVSVIPNITQFTKDLSKGGEFKFEAKLSGSYIKILPKNLRNKMCKVEHFKQKNVQFCVVPDRKIPMKVIIGRLPISTCIDKINEILTFKGLKLNLPTKKS